MAEWRDPSELRRPVEMGWLFVTRGGQTWVRITLDALSLADVDESLTHQPLVWWQAVWAPLMCTDTSCPLMYVKDPRNPGPGAMVPGNGSTGVYPGPSLGNRESPVIVLQSGVMNGEGNRRLYIPGITRDAAEEGMLTLQGQVMMNSLSRALAAGTFSQDALAGPDLIVWRKARPATSRWPAVPDAWARVEKVTFTLQTGRWRGDVV